MTIIIKLTPEQVRAIKPEMAKTRVASHNSEPGMLLAQVFDTEMRVGFVPADKAKTIQIISGATPGSKTSSIN